MCDFGGVSNMILAGDRHWLTKSVDTASPAYSKSRGQSSFADSVAKMPLLCVGYCMCAFWSS